MAQKGVQLDQETFSCCICLDLLKDPVTIPCGHSYCMNCIKDHWDVANWRKRYNCPQCRQTFTSRPHLVKNTMLADLVEELQKTGLQDTPASEGQSELERSRHNIQQRIQDRQKDLKLLQQEVENISRSADKTVEDSQKIFTQLIRLMEQRRHDVEQQVRSQQEAEVSRVKKLEEKLEQEIRELKRKDAELKKLSDTEDHSQFLQDYPSLSGLSGSTYSSSINIRPLSNFQDVTAAVSKLRDQLQELLRDTRTDISVAVTEADVSLLGPGPEPKTRAEFLKYSCEITLDPNTVHRQVKLSEGNKKAKGSPDQSYPDHPDRFTASPNVLSRESLTGRCYWELECSGRRVYVAVSYKNICETRKQRNSFGATDRSWMIHFDKDSFTFYHNNIGTPLPGPVPSRLGVYLDHRAGLLSFYSISRTMTLLHRVQTTFTQPLHVGFGGFFSSTAEILFFFSWFCFILVAWS